MDKRDLFGVEIEIEDCGHDIYQLEEDCIHNWRFTEDGTLRNGGVELVSGGVQSQKDLAVIDEMMDQFGWDEDNVSFRCSSHIHVDTRQLSSRGRMMFVMLLLNADREFFSIGGEGRDQSLFCVPASHPVNMLYVISNVAGRGNGTNYDLKYCSINPMPLRRTGSVELRHFHPILTNDKLIEITNLILSAYDMAIEYQEKSFSKFFQLDILSDLMKGMYSTGSFNYYIEDL